MRTVTNKSGERADRILQGLLPHLSRSRIKDLIVHGKVAFKDKSSEWVVLKKAGTLFEADHLLLENWRIDAEEWTRYVSRGGLKLQGALKYFDRSVNGKVCLDVGLSTGGFSHCLLESGAEKVLGIDVGQGQLSPLLQKDSRLLWRDKVNARSDFPTDLLEDFFKGSPHQFDLIVVDVSFISLSKIVPNLTTYLKTGGGLLALVKPQFELGPEALNSKGVVKESVDAMSAVEKNIGMFTENRLKIIGQCSSVIEGENGNKEFFILAERI